ncbi:hypothetical protein BJY04DRAFT_199618 [Aspergillus karnatakaensis]|uniref:uncharacterized protein n=1 Tax=Aspergillus karnatakaensis TaxID=1810916 RepID=UPI003CCD4872
MKLYLATSERDRFIPVYAVHDACWRLLHQRLGSSGDEHDIADSLFQVLYTTPGARHGMLDLGVDYELHPQPGNKWNPYPHCLVDPSEIPPLREMEASAPEEPHLLYRNFTMPQSNPHGFGRLSIELLHQILSNLSFAQLGPVRLVCQLFLEAIDNPPQSYWRERFVLGQEADFLFPDFAAVEDWRRLFFGTRALLNSGNPALVNRKRVARVIEPVAAAIELSSILGDDPAGYRAEQPPREGRQNTIWSYYDTDTRPTYLQLGHGLPPQYPQGLKIMRSLYGYHAQSTSRSTYAICHRVWAWMPGFQLSVGRIVVSTVVVGDAMYIAGIRIESSNGGADSNMQLGFITRNEASMDILSACRISAIEVAFRLEGLTGIQFLFEDTEPSCWFGDIEDSRVAFGIIRFPQCLGPCALVAGSDRFRIFSLGFGELIEPLPSGTWKPPQDKSDPETCLWKPYRPAHNPLHFSLSFANRPIRLSGPMQNVDFGGPRGVLLNTLVRIVFYMDRNTPYTGIESFYKDGVSRLFGYKRGCEISFLIDGPIGERITQVRLLTSGRPARVVGLQLLTNHGRTATFARIEDRICSDVEILPEIPEGHIITGLVRSPSWRGPSMVIQSQPCDDKLATTTTTSAACPSCVVPDDQVGYVNSRKPSRDRSQVYLVEEDYSYHTYAPLQNVRRISVSTGADGRARPADCISGLKVEYHYRTAGVIVGQWMDPCSPDPFELTPDEGIHSLTVWLRNFSPLRITSQCDITRIDLVTTCGREGIFRASGFDEMQNHPVKYSLEQKDALDAISWDFDLKYDVVRGVAPLGQEATVTISPEMQEVVDEDARKRQEWLDRRGQARTNNATCAG